MKNIFNLLLITLFSLVFSQNTYSQTDSIKVSITDVKGSPGDTVCVDIKADNFKDISAMQFSIAWDASKMDFVSFSNTNAQLSIPDFIFANPSAGKATVIYVNATGSTTLADGSILMSVCFKIKMPVGQSDNVCMVGSPTNIEFSDKTQTIIPVKKTIKCGLVQSVLPDLKPLKLIGSFETVKKGDTACVVFTVDDFTKIKKLEFDFDWDASKLKFEYFSMVNTKFATNGAGTPFFAPFVVNSGKIEIRWDATKHAGASDVTLPSGTVLFKLCFKTIGNQGDLIPIPVATVPAANVVTATSNNGNVGLTGTVGKVKILQTDFKPIEIAIGSYTGDASQDFCVDIKASNMDNIIGLQYSMQWDPEFLKFKEIKNLYPFVSNATTTFNRSEEHTSELQSRP